MWRYFLVLPTIILGQDADPGGEDMGPMCPGDPGCPDYDPDPNPEPNPDPGPVPAATNCASAEFSGEELYQNLVVAAVVDVMNAVALKSASELKTAINDAANGIGISSTVPTRNSFLSNSIDTAGHQCGGCAHTFYTAVYNELMSIRLPAEAPVSNAEPIPCGGVANVNGATTYNYGGPDNPWSAISGNQIALLSDASCVDVLANAITAFNACNNPSPPAPQYTILTGLAPCSSDEFGAVAAAHPLYLVMMKKGLIDSAYPSGYTAPATCASCFTSFESYIASVKDELIISTNRCGDSSILSLYGTESTDCLAAGGVVADAVDVFELCTGNSLSTTIPVCTQDDWSKLRLANVPRFVFENSFADDAVSRFWDYAETVQVDGIPCVPCLADLVTGLGAVGRSEYKMCSRDPYSSACTESSLGSVLSVFKTCSGGFAFDYASPCSEEDLKLIDGDFGIYSTVMTAGLENEELSQAFQDEFSQLSCRVCFYNFLRTVKTNRVAWAADCGGRVFHADCTGIPEVTAAVAEFGRCTGQASLMHTTQSFPATLDEKIVFNDALNFYTMINDCGAQFDPANALTSWNDCMLSHSPVLDIEGRYSSVESFGGCVRSLASGLNAWNTACANTPTTDVCVSSLASNLQTFHNCAGFQLSVDATECSANEIERIPSQFKTYPMLVEMAIKAETEADAARMVFRDSDLMDALSGMSCSSCYAAFAVELASVMTVDNDRLCADAYSSECANGSFIKAALERFESCSGFTLSQESSYACTSSEWDIMRSAEIPAFIFESIRPSSEYTLTHALFVYDTALKAVKSDYPDLLFKCSMCLQTFIQDMHGTQAAEDCYSDIGSAQCRMQGGQQALQKFKSCSGHDFDMTKPSSVQGMLNSNTIAPISTTTTTSVESVVTTKTVATGIPVSLTAILALQLINM